MSKRIALKDFIEVDHNDISSLCRAITFNSDDEQVDVSGFNATGSDEFLAGKRTQTITLEVFGSWGANEIHQTLYPLYRDRALFDFKWRHDQTAAVSSTNPELSGVGQLLSYSPGATRGDAETFQVTISAGDENGFTFSET